MPLLCEKDKAVQERTSTPRKSLKQVFRPVYIVALLRQESLKSQLHVRFRSVHCNAIEHQNQPFERKSANEKERALLKFSTSPNTV